jgi:hypothetical protein
VQARIRLRSCPLRPVKVCINICHPFYFLFFLFKTIKDKIIYIIKELVPRKSWSKKKKKNPQQQQHFGRQFFNGIFSD